MADQKFEPDSEADDFDGVASSAQTPVRTPSRPLPIPEGNEGDASSSSSGEFEEPHLPQHVVIDALVAANLQRRTPAQRNLSSSARLVNTERAIREAAAYASSRTIVGTQSPVRRVSQRTSRNNLPSARQSAIIASLK